MRSLLPIPEGPLVWKQTAAFSRAYEMRDSDDGVRERLVFQKLIGTHAEAQSGRRVWELARHGNPTGRTSIRPPGALEEYAWFLPHAVGKKGHLTWNASGRKMIWLPTNIWETEWQFVTEEDEGIAGFKRRDALTTTVEVHFADWAGEEADLDLLLGLGLYSLILDEDPEGATR